MRQRMPAALGLSCLALATLAAGPRALAQPGCNESAYLPDAVYHQILRSAEDAGIGALPAGYDIGPSLDTSRVNLLRDSALVGQVSYEGDARADIRTLTAYDARGQPLLRMTDRSWICGGEAPRGLCREIVTWTEREPVIDGLAAYAMRYPPGRSTADWFRYGYVVSPYDWRVEMNQSLAWLLGIYLTSADVVALTGATPRARLAIALASDPLVAKYLDMFQIFDGVPRLILTGVVPSTAVWYRIIDIGRDMGLYVDPRRMIIDTRTARPLDPYFLLADCYR